MIDPPLPAPRLRVRRALGALALAGILAVAACGHGGERVRVSPVAQVRADVATLAADSMRGRETPSPDLDDAARFIRHRFERLGLRPLNASGRFVLAYPFTRTVELGPGAYLAVATGRAPDTLLAGQDVALAPARASGGLAPLFDAGRFTNAARGLPAGARGRVVLVRDVPRELFRLDTWIWQFRKVGRAADVRGLVLSLAPGEPPLAAIADHLDGPFSPPVSEGVPELPVAVVNAAIGRRLTAAGAVELHAPIRDVHVQSAPNVAAAAGRPAPPTLVYVAHFDHIGLRTKPVDADSIFNGADDNASGVAALLDIARRFSGMPRVPDRVLFLAVSGEEHGMVGSRAFLAQGHIDVSRVRAVINLDMIGRGRPETLLVDTVGATALYSRLQRIARQCPDLGLRPRPLPPELDLDGRSDHASFRADGAPSLSLFTGFHEDYHAVTDEPGTIDSDKVTRIARLAFALGRSLVEDQERPPCPPAGSP